MLPGDMYYGYSGLRTDMSGPVNPQPVSKPAPAPVMNARDRLRQRLMRFKSTIPGFGRRGAGMGRYGQDRGDAFSDLGEY